MADDLDITDLSADEIADGIKDWAEVVNAEAALAQQAVDYWQSIAPVGDPATDPHSGAYQASIQVQRSGSDVYAMSDSDIASIIEYGTATSPEHGCRARTEAYMNGLS